MIKQYIVLLLWEFRDIKILEIIKALLTIMSQSINANTLSASQRLVSPSGQNLTDATTRTLAPSMGAIAYGSDTNILYYGSVDAWNVAGSTGSTGSPGLTTIGPFNIGSTANGATIASQTLTLYSADTTNPGGVNTASQSYAGVKTFTDGLAVTPVVSAGVSNLFSAYSIVAFANTVSYSGAITIPSGTQDGVIEHFRGHNVMHLDRAVSTSAGGLITVLFNGAVMPSEFRPGTSGRKATITVVTAGVVQQGYANITNAGVMTIGIGQDSSGNLLPFPVDGTVNGNGIMDNTFVYTSF